MTFDQLNLNKPLLSALDDLGYEYPTPIQEKAFPVIMSGRDVVAIAQTGTGKTFAYLLPLLRQLKYSDQKHPRILIIVPTRELVLQIVKEIEKLSSYMNIRYQGVYGGTNINTQKQLVYNGLDVLVATPGRLVDLALTGLLRLKDIQKLVIDEVDQMLSLGFRQQLISFLDTLPKKRQTLMFSATINDEVENVIAKYFYEPLKVEAEKHGTPLEKIIQKAYHVPNFYTKVNLLEYLLDSDRGNELSKVLVFVENKKLADKLFEHIGKNFIDQVSLIHSGLSQNNRIAALSKFHKGEKRVLIATDILARGLDISDVTHVINFDTSSAPEDYIHRIGRTGRANKAGTAISFINEAEQVFQIEIEKLMGQEIPMLELPEEVEISKLFTEEERPAIKDKNIKRIAKIKTPQGAFHEKKEKNKKVNLGGPSVKDPKKGKSTRKSNKNWKR